MGLILNKKKDSVIIEIKGKPINKFFLFILIFFSIIGFFLPLVPILFFVDKIQIGFLLTIIVYWGVGFYFFRWFLWNAFGKEIIEINNSSIKYVCDYKIFKSNKSTLEYQNLEVQFLNEDKNAVKLDELDAYDGNLFLKIIENEKIITSHIAFSKSNVNQIVSSINSFGFNLNFK